MADKKELREELDWTTAKISSQVWILNLGTLGTAWTLLISGSVAAPVRFTFADARWIFLLCLLGLACDMLQYLSALRVINKAREKLRASGSRTVNYDDKSWPYILRKFFFRAKVALTMVAALWLLAILFIKLT